MAALYRGMDLRIRFQADRRIPQFFVLPSDEQIPALFLVKVVDDILLAGETREIEKFSKAISKRFEVGRALIDIYLIFNKLLIK